MMMEIAGDVIWMPQLRRNAVLCRAVATLPAGETIELSVDDILGSWMVIRDAERPRRIGLRPVGPMLTVWRRMQSRLGEKIDVSLKSHETSAWIRAYGDLFSDWRSAADEEAFGAF